MTETATDAGAALAATIADKQVQRGTATAFDLVASMAGEFGKALPPELSPEKFVRDALTELRQSPDLQACTAESLLGAFMTAARLGLEVGGHLGHFYLTPRNVKNKRTGEHEKQVVPIVGYRGLMELARRSGRVGAVGADMVRAGDVFRQGFDSTRGGKFTIWEPVDYEETREIVGVLAWAEVGNGIQARYLPIAQVMERKGRGAAGDSGPWRTDREAMIRKTGLRALASDLPQSTALALARQLDEQVQTFTPEETLDAGTGELTA
jgi:recombination protein RecT